LFGGGWTGALSSTIQYITIASTGNAANFGNLTQARNLLASCSSSTVGVFAGGATGSQYGTAQNTIDYVTIASTGNATDFGDLTVASYWQGAMSSSTRGVFGGGGAGSVNNVIAYITIASTGNATDFGDLAANVYSLGGCSNAHGGI
jgi:hypothetical protein